MRTFNYRGSLPYETESDEVVEKNLDAICDGIFQSFSSEDWPLGIYWTQELRDWLSLKFVLPKQRRIALIKVYYEVITAFGIDSRAHSRFMSCFLELTKKRYYLNGIEDLVLDWRALWHVIKRVVIPSGELIIRAVQAEDLHHLKTLAHAQQFFHPDETSAILEEFLPLFQTSILNDAFLSVYLICSFLPTSSTKYVDEVMPSIFHLWNLLASSHITDAIFIEFISRWTRDTLLSTEPSKQILTKEQLDYAFTHFLRLMKIPVGNSSGSSSKNLDAHARNLFFSRKFAASKDFARLCIYSLPNEHIMSHLEVFFEAVDTFFHPSNSGPWMHPLSSFAFELVSFYQLRMNREKSGELLVKDGRSLDCEELCQKFVKILRKVSFMATYARSHDIQNLAQATLQGLAFIAPDLIMPGALKRIYPSLQGLVEAHRTTASLHSLASLTAIIVKDNRWRVHLTSLITLALPGIDANDLNKTSITFIFLTQVCHLISIEDLSESGDTGLAMQYVQTEMARLENMITDDDDSSEEKSFPRPSEDEMLEIVKSSTAAFRDILTMFLDRIFNLLENLPHTTSSRSGEMQVQNDLACLLSPFFAALSSELLEFAAQKVIRFVTGHTLPNAADCFSMIIGALTKTNPELAYKEMFQPLDLGIRTEVLENGAGSTRSGGSEILPRDRGLIWYLRAFEGLTEPGGELMFKHSKEIRSLISFLMEHCVSQATEYTGLLIACYIEGLIETYNLDCRRVAFEDEGFPERGLESWGHQTNPVKLKIRWHTPSRPEIEEACNFYMDITQYLIQKVRESIQESRNREARVNQEWNDILTNRLSYINEVLGGATEMFSSDTTHRRDEELDLSDLEYNCKYPSGYIFPDRNDLLCMAVHARRDEIGELLHEVHNYLSEYHADNILCFDVLLLVIKTWFGNVGYQRAEGCQSKLSSIYVEDIANFKLPGKRKAYPRSYLVRRALLYHVQRTKHSALTLSRTPLHEVLLKDLMQTAIGTYTEIRVIAQSALNLAVRAVSDCRGLVIPYFLESLKPGDEERIKGALYTLSGKGLKSFIGRNFNFFPQFLMELVRLSNLDKKSMILPVKQAFLECVIKSRPPAGVTVYNAKELCLIEPATKDKDNPILKLKRAVADASAFREKCTLKLRDDLIDASQVSDWRVASAASSALSASISSSGLPPSSRMAKSIIELAIHDHPQLRAIALAQLGQLLFTCWLRVLTKGDMRDAVLENLSIPGKKILTSKKDGNFGKDILAGLSDPRPEYFVDNERAGWLAWPETLEVFERGNGGEDMDIDSVTRDCFDAMSAGMNLVWMSKLIDFWKEEPKDGGGKFRSQLAHLIRAFFICSRRMSGAVTLDELKPQIEELCAKGALHYHARVGAEFLAGLIGSLRYETDEVQDEVWAWVTPIIHAVLTERLTPDNISYWQNCVSSVFLHRDPRRFYPLLEIVAKLPMDMESHSAFAESSKISVLRKTITAVGWHFQPERQEQVIEKFMAHIDHPYKKVRDEIGRALNHLFAMQYFEAHPTVTAFLRANSAADSSLGVIPYKPNEQLTIAMSTMFKLLQKWRLERIPGTETPTQYTMGSKTMATWVYNSIDMVEAYLLLPFVPDLILPEILYMMDVKEDHDLLVIAVGVFKQLGNIVYPISQITPMTDSLVNVMTTSTSWHHRLRIMAIVQVFFYRNMFILGRKDRQRLFDSIVHLLSDPQLEVREGAASTISGMIRASSYDRDNTITRLVSTFSHMLEVNKLPPKRKRDAPSQDDPSVLNSIIIKRHSACLGLAALVTAFPYDTPPAWLPPVLARLARCSDNPHPIGVSIKRVLASFKKTHNDTWHTDQKVFSQEELDDLAEPSHTYFA